MAPFLFSCTHHVPYRSPSIPKEAANGTAFDILHTNKKANSTTSMNRHYSLLRNQTDRPCSVSQDDIHGKQQSTVNGMDAVAPRGIAGRGVLIDYHSWAQRNGVEFDQLGGHAITLASVEKIIKEDGRRPRNQAGPSPT
jgi:hypothetical protein